MYVCVDDVGADPTHLGSWAAWSLFSVRSSACGAVLPASVRSSACRVLRAIKRVRVASDLVSVDSCDRARVRGGVGVPPVLCSCLGSCACTDEVREASSSGGVEFGRRRGCHVRWCAVRVRWALCGAEPRPCAIGEAACTAPRGSLCERGVGAFSKHLCPFVRACFVCRDVGTMSLLPIGSSRRSRSSRRATEDALADGSRSSRRATEDTHSDDEDVYYDSGRAGNTQDLCAHPRRPTRRCTVRAASRARRL